MHLGRMILLGSLVALLGAFPAVAQRAPSETEVAGYSGLHRAAHKGDISEVRRLIAAGADLNARDAYARTPLHVAAYASQEEAVAVLVAAGADPNALEKDRYDMVTIAAVADDLRMLKAALAAGNRATLVTSPYDGTALIAASHLGHAEVVRTLIEAGAPLDHINNLGFTALIEAVILGDGGPAHQATVRYLVAAGANKEIRDRLGYTPLDHADRRGQPEVVKILRGG